ncbi:hypothetical protein NCC49_000342 [Naganishia albida]|nr:hypothetical protein NCC49_000342 [Naganishia albida]
MTSCPTEQTPSQAPTEGLPADRSTASLNAGSSVISAGDGANIRRKGGVEEEFPDVAITESGMTGYIDNIVDGWFKRDQEKGKRNREPEKRKSPKPASTQQ